MAFVSVWSVLVFISTHVTLEHELFFNHLSSFLADAQRRFNRRGPRKRNLVPLSHRVRLKTLVGIYSLLATCLVGQV